MKLNYKKEVVFRELDVKIDCEAQSCINITNLELLKYFKGKYRTYDKLEAEFMWQKFVYNDDEEMLCPQLVSYIKDNFESVVSFTYEEAFKIENNNFQAMVFGTISVPDMIKHLGHNRIKADGKTVVHKQYSKEGEYLGTKEYEVVYETHEVKGEELNVGAMFALKCWCTSTNEEHWLFIEEKYKNDPLEAVAQTFRVHKSLIPFIKEIKRQGDILAAELKPENELTSDEIKKLNTVLGELKKESKEEKHSLVPLTAKQYFGFLTAQS